MRIRRNLNFDRIQILLSKAHSIILNIKYSKLNSVSKHEAFIVTLKMIWQECMYPHYLYGDKLRAFVHLHRNSSLKRSLDGAVI